jgi:predicted alpha/beta-hydrolase family hydrolase
MYESFSNSAVDPPVQGFLHRASSPSGDGLVLTHGAGGNAQMVMLVALAETFAGAGFIVLRCNLPFRQKKPFGPPGPGNGAQDREGLKNAVAAVRKLAPGRVFLGGQSYGGRQASMLLADEPVADGLILLSYPLHPPGKPEQLRTQHLPNLHVPTLFVEGTLDPFATIEEIEHARRLIPAKTELLTVEGAGHDLGFKGKSKREELPAMVKAEFRRLFGIRAP